jgi:hypothetical protein
MNMAAIRLGDSKQWPFGAFLFGLFMVLLAVIGTFTGKAYGKGGTVDRATEPFSYWLCLIIQCLCGVFLMLSFWPK